MFNLENLVAILAELIRVLLVDELSEHVRRLFRRVRLRAPLNNIGAIRRHVHFRCRARLLNRISTRR